MTYVKTNDLSSPYTIEKLAEISKYVRNYYSLTQTDLAEELGITRQTVSRLESRSRTPNNDVLQAILSRFLRIWNEQLNEGFDVRQHLDKGLMLGKARTANKIDLDPKTQAQLTEKFKQDIKTTEGENFWITAGLIGLGYLMLQSLTEDN
ncbi:MAG: helix-turn-helix transcriptional regulator [Candidatus Poribacteria bacterium]|jgi:transcriptional regulator with XRE-family HTH domain|nr:helix-turn-helix transcriptional regulator [Candidatus Poribacteria bacterium]